MQVLLALEHTIFKIDDTIDDYKRFLKFLNLHFNVKSIKENQFFVPRAVECTQHRKQLMKWLYSFYKKDAKNFNDKLKFELLQRIDKPIHIHFLSSNKTTPITISATFYEDSICQLLLAGKSRGCREYIIEYFKGLVTEKSLSLFLYELKLVRIEDKYKLREFFQKKEIHNTQVSMLYNSKAFDAFLLSSKKSVSTEFENACNILHVSESDSFEKIKKHYRKLAKAYHPDLSCLAPDVSTVKFQILLNAFDIIKRYKAAA